MRGTSGALLSKSKGKGVLERRHRCNAKQSTLFPLLLFHRSKRRNEWYGAPFLVAADFWHDLNSHEEGYHMADEPARSGLGVADQVSDTLAGVGWAACTIDDVGNRTSSTQRDRDHIVE